MIWNKTYPVYHCYQRLIDKGVIFYSDLDHLMYFTIICAKAPKYDIVILKLVQMWDHLHQSVSEMRTGHMRAFFCDVTSTFSREYNNCYNRRGALFEGPFGRAKKVSEKSIRTNLLYLDNNPVERQLVKCAEEYRWNYLAYAVSDHPFSEKIKLREASMKLRKALKRVKYCHKKGLYLTVPVLKSLYKGLSEKETEQLTDFIISCYSVIDYEVAGSYFKSYEDELLAAKATTGREYDLNEHFLGRSDKYYSVMEHLLLKYGKVEDVHEILSMSMENKKTLLSFLRNRMGVPVKQIAAFLHIV